MSNEEKTCKFCGKEIESDDYIEKRGWGENDREYAHTDCYQNEVEA